MHLSQDKLTPSEELGDLMRRAGDNEAALGIYQKANVPQKVIEGLAAKGDFEALSKFRYRSEFCLQAPISVTPRLAVHNSWRLFQPHPARLR